MIVLNLSSFFINNFHNLQKSKYVHLYTKGMQYIKLLAFFNLTEIKYFVSTTFLGIVFEKNKKKYVYHDYSISNNIQTLLIS